MSVSVKINNDTAMKKIHAAIKKKGEPLARKRAYALFWRARNMMLKDFDRHPITQELKNSGRTGNISLTTDGYGNLFAFFGFEAGDEPTGELRNLLEAGTVFRSTGFRNNAWFFRITTPDTQTIENITLLPWGSGHSWVDSVENGLDGLAFFMYKKGQGRSQQGFQAPYEINDDLQFNKREYLTEIMRNFRDRINNSSVNEA
jgi:hypothetical protein